MLTPYIVMIVGVLLAAGAAFWTLRAVRRAGANAGTGRFVLLVCACASVVALGVYLVNGRPELAGGAFGIVPRTKGTGSEKGGFGIGLARADLPGGLAAWCDAARSPANRRRAPFIPG